MKLVKANKRNVKELREWGEYISDSFLFIVLNRSGVPLPLPHEVRRGPVRNHHLRSKVVSWLGDSIIDYAVSSDSEVSF